jgi:hypothetical protein
MTFTVSIDERDIVFACETGETVLDAAERAGYSLPYSCRRGKAGRPSDLAANGVGCDRISVRRQP